MIVHSLYAHGHLHLNTYLHIYEHARGLSTHPYIHTVMHPSYTQVNVQPTSASVHSSTWAHDQWFSTCGVQPFIKPLAPKLFTSQFIAVEKLLSYEVAMSLLNPQWTSTFFIPSGHRSGTSNVTTNHKQLSLQPVSLDRMLSQHGWRFVQEAALSFSLPYVCVWNIMFLLRMNKSRTVYLCAVTAQSASVLNTRNRITCLHGMKGER